MIELKQTILTDDNVFVPAGTRLVFKNGFAEYMKHKISRAKVPLQAIKGARGPFLNAVCATILNDNKGFQEAYNKRFQDWAHCVAIGDYLVVYIWDTREIIDIMPGLHAAVNGGPIVRRLINKKTGERIEQTIGHTKYGWAKYFYDMLTWPQYHRLDNGLPLVTKEKGWQEIVAKFNQNVEQNFAYESFNDALRAEYAEQGLAMPDGSYPITDKEDLKNAVQAYGRAKDKDAVKAHIIKRAKELNALKELPESWLQEGIEAITIVPAQGVANTHNILLGDIQVGRIFAKKLRKVSFGTKLDAGQETEATDDEKPTEGEAPTESEQNAEPATGGEKPTAEDKDVPTANFGYYNLGDSKLTVVDNDNAEIDLGKLLDNDVILEKELIDALDKHFAAANENLTHKLLDSYPFAIGAVDYVHTLPILTIYDLYQLCQHINDVYGELPTIQFMPDKVVDVIDRRPNSTLKMRLDFKNNTYHIDAGEDMLPPLHLYIRTHFISLRSI